MMTKRSFIPFVLVTLMALMVVGAGGAAAADAARLQRGPHDPIELASWLDALIEERMAQNQVTGVVFVAVRDGQVLYSKGYGLADIASGRTIDPQTDVWRVMSISKPVTALAIMQLAEQGALDLAADVNRYLTSLQLDDRMGVVTAGNLLTHTAGLDFDLDDIGNETRNAADMLPLSGFMQQNPPVQVRVPGEIPVYSNAAFDLLGLMIQDITGQPFEAYMDEHILAPLGMTSSSFRQPPPAAGSLVTAYEFDGETHRRPAPYPFFHNPPSRSLTSSAPDMANLLIALLADGALGDRQVLQPESVQTMLSTRFSSKPGTAGSGYGFDQQARAGSNMLWKDGSGNGALSQIVLYPDENLGYFIAQNLDDHFDLIGHVSKGFDERYFPVAEQPAAPTTISSDEIAAVSGVYRVPYYGRSTIAKAVRLGWDPYPQVKAAGDGRLHVSYGPGTDPVVLQPVAPLHYRDIENGLDYVFVRGEDGQVTHFSVSAYAAEKVPWYDVDRNHRLMLFAFMLVFLMGALAWPLAALLRRRRRQPAVTDTWARRALILLTLASALNFMFLVVLFTYLSFVAYDFSVSMPLHLLALLAIPLVTGLLALILAGFSVLLWWKQSSSLAGRLLISLFTLVALLFIPWLNYWNLLGWR